MPGVLLQAGLQPWLHSQLQGEGTGTCVVRGERGAESDQEWVGSGLHQWTVRLLRERRGGGGGVGSSGRVQPYLSVLVEVAGKYLFQLSANEVISAGLQLE